MWTVDWSKVTDWTPEMIMARQAEQQTLQIKRIADSLERIGRLAVDLREAEVEQRQIAELALQLMVEKETVLQAFGDEGHLGFAQLRGRLWKAGFRSYGDHLTKAVPLTDYLVLEPIGAGWRVWLAKDYAAAKGAA